MAELKYGTLYEVPGYSAWRIAFPSHSKIYLVFGSKPVAEEQAQKIRNKYKRQGKNLSKPSIRNVTKTLGGW